MRRPLLIGNEMYRHSVYGPKHPLAIPRVSTTLDLIRAMGWFDSERYVESRPATPAELGRFHAPDYIAALVRAEIEGEVDAETRERYNIGRNGNPVFPEIFRRPATACGATLKAVELLAEGGIVYSPAGGTHHGRADRASGFCYFNDPVLGILKMLDRGIARILYVDLDAHHGDGVEDAFAEDDRVLTISVHEAGRWPNTGRAEERRGGMARNLPVPPGFNDSELAYIVERALLPLGRSFRPDALLIQAGADALADDPQSRLMLSNRALWAAVGDLAGLAPRLLVLGGGGYNPWSVARCWTGIWATLNGHATESALTPEAEAVLGSLRWNHSLGRSPPSHWLTTLADAPRPGPVRLEIVGIVEEVMRT
ncbi:MAG: acetoin utilization protein AcuC [Proteobacteria bacterium]|nr:acetoin utilization protein AcuC [Pseudomonadota bacterium]MBI3495923.1 acetoin utilization protein AcuC [Pseudomonadota bacterium]